MSTKTASKISPTDLRRHKRMLQRVVEARELQIQVNQIMARQQELIGAFKVWSEELHERYGLATDGTETVNEDGTITRQLPPASTDPPKPSTKRRVSKP